MWKVKTLNLLKEIIREKSSVLWDKKRLLKQQTKSGNCTGEKRGSETTLKLRLLFFEKNREENQKTSQSERRSMQYKYPIEKDSHPEYIKNCYESLRKRTDKSNRKTSILPPKSHKWP